MKALRRFGLPAAAFAATLTVFALLLSGCVSTGEPGASSGASGRLSRRTPAHGAASPQDLAGRDRTAAGVRNRQRRARADGP